MEEKKLWEKCVGFHGHECGGLAIGFKAALYARELLGLGRAAARELGRHATELCRGERL